MYKKIEKGSPEWMMFQGFWKLRQQYYTPENTDEYWNAAIHDVSDFINKYRDTDIHGFADDLGRVLMDDFERRKTW